MTDATFDEFRQIVATQLDIDEAKVEPDASFIEDLNADSLDLVELIMAFEEKYGIGIPEEEAEKIRTVGQAWTYVQEHQGAPATAS